jgi:iodotyrosine deiodinase
VTGVKENIEGFVAQGGVLYLSDFAFRYMTEAFPGRVDIRGYEGKHGITTDAEVLTEDSVGESFKNWLANRDVLNPDGTVHIEGFSTGWVVIESVDAPVRVWIRGEVTYGFTLGSLGSNEPSHSTEGRCPATGRLSRPVDTLPPCAAACGSTTGKGKTIRYTIADPGLCARTRANRSQAPARVPRLTRLRMLECVMADDEPLRGYPSLSDAERLRRVEAFEAAMQSRRSVRQFSDTAVPPAVIESALRTAGRAPSGANQQPWTFVAVSDPGLKRRIRSAAEAAERRFYRDQAPREWLDALEPLGTGADKPFLETAPWLIAVFAQPHGVRPDGAPTKHYYVKESVGLATGFLLAALHHAGLATLTYTPSPMGFLSDILERPSFERAFMLVVTGVPAEDARVPRISKKPLEDIARFMP